jgi:predicted glutamine amidotransferase
MCELFGMSARFPTTIHLSLDELARHGGGRGPRDGWGIAFAQQGDALVVREPGAVSESACRAFLQQQDIRRETVIAVALLASVPLSRERWESLSEGEIVVLREGRVVQRRALVGGKRARLRS